MTKWQGIGAAVDAHLSRLGFANRGILLAKKIREDRDFSEKTVRRFMENDWGWRWVMFSASYGLPDETGRPKIEALIQEGQTISGREQFGAEEVAIEQGAYLGLREQRMLTRATSHYVSANVINEVNLAASLAEPEPIFDTDLFTPYGFAILEKPLEMPDLDPDTGLVHPSIVTHIRAIGWCREEAIFSSKDDAFHPGVSIFLYTTRDDYANGFYASAKAAGKDPYPPDTVDSGTSPDGLTPFEVIPWCFGVDWQGRDIPHYEPGSVPIPVANERRWFMAFMRLCWQEIIVRQVHRPDRPTSRRWERMAKGKLLDYSVLHLRREVDPTYKPEYTGGTLDYHQYVRGAWRRVHLKKMGPARLPDGRMDPNTHRLKWIEPYWRGPEDGPEGPMHKATSVTR
jgi:hypothetical protein